jgi:hypothetical protein
MSEKEQKTAWWISGDQYEGRFEKQREERLVESSQEQFTVNYCESCKKAYQYSWDRNGKKLFYFSDFPTYGLIRKECVKCK